MTHHNNFPGLKCAASDNMDPGSTCKSALDQCTGPFIGLYLFMNDLNTITCSGNKLLSVQIINKSNHKPINHTCTTIYSSSVHLNLHPLLDLPNLGLSEMHYEMVDHTNITRLVLKGLTTDNDATRFP